MPKACYVWNVLVIHWRNFTQAGLYMYIFLGYRNTWIPDKGLRHPFATQGRDESEAEVVWVEGRAQVPLHCGDLGICREAAIRLQ